MLLDGWLRTALKAAETTGDRLGKANTLQSLGDLESRLGNIEAARAHYDAALPLYEAEQARLGKANTLQSLGDLESRLGNIEAARAHYDAALNFYRKEQEPGGIINTLVSQARLEAAQGAITKALEKYEEAFAVADGSGFAQHPVVQGMRQEYEHLRRLAASSPGSEKRSAHSIPDDPLTLGLAAFLQADSPEALSQALEQHPILQESDALFALAGSLNQALVAADSQATSFLIARFVLLLGIYNHAHSQEVNPQTREAIINLCEQFMPLVEGLDADLAATLREQIGWACNTLGNYYAEEKKPNQAIAAYSRGLKFAPENAMLLRNRAGEQIEAGQLDAAQADIDAAAALEPEAPRLVELRAALEQARKGGKEKPS